MQSELSLKYRDPFGLKPYPGNARSHPKKQLQQLEASIAVNGFINPALIDEHGVIIAGHCRVQVAKKLGLKSIPTITLEGLNEVQKARIRLADNRIAENAAWDLDFLAAELKRTELKLPSDYLEIGFDPGRVDAILSTPVTFDDEKIPEVPDDPVSRAGDIWILGQARHRIGCGDCRDRPFLKQVLAGGVADAAFLDVPYNLKIDGHAVSKGRHRDFAMASGEMSPEQFTDFLKDALGACAAETKDGGINFVCMDQHHLEELMAACQSVYGSRLAICVWDKECAGLGSLYRNQCEYVFVQKVGKAPHFNAVELGKHGRNRTTIWRYPGANSPKGSRRHDLELHATVKNLAMVSDAICDVTRRNELVLDAFMGSGTTALACERTGRRSAGVELDPAYVDLTLQRFTDRFGGEAVLEATGQTFGEVRRERAISHEGALYE